MTTDQTPPTSANPAPQVIVEVGSDGGSLTLYGIQAPEGWTYRAAVNEKALGGAPDTPGRRPWVATWEDGLAQLDSYPWPSLYPVKVHPDFIEQVTSALQEREKNGRRINWDYWDDVMGKPLRSGKPGRRSARRAS